MLNKQKKYYRAKELAKYFGIGLSTVWLYAKQEKIKPIKLSSRVTVFNIEEFNNVLLISSDDTGRGSR